jgi:hypothetical protein
VPSPLPVYPKSQTIWNTLRYDSRNQLADLMVAMHLSPSPTLFSIDLPMVNTTGRWIEIKTYDTPQNVSPIPYAKDWCYSSICRRQNTRKALHSFTVSDPLIYRCRRFRILPGITIFVDPGSFHWPLPVTRVVASLIRCVISFTLNDH